MPNVNIVVLAGHLTRDPEVRNAASGTAVCKLGMATNNRKKDSSGQWVDDPVFIDVACFGKTAEAMGNMARKGSAVLVDGRLQLEQWEDKNGGGKRSKISVIADKVQLLDGGRRQQQQSDGSNAAPVESVSQAGGGEEIPF